MSRKSFLIVSLAILAVMLVGYFGYSLTAGGQMRAVAEVSRQVPETMAPSFDEKHQGFASADLKGQVTLVSFFASWCSACQINHHMLIELAQTKKARIWGINLRDQLMKAQIWLMTHGNPFERIGQDPLGEIAAKWGVRGIPQMFVVDKKGMIRAVFTGVLLPERVQDALLPLIEKLEQEPAE